jgi:hypothetical protein
MKRSALALAVVAASLVIAAPADAKSRCKPVRLDGESIRFVKVVGMTCANARSVARQARRCNIRACVAGGMSCKVTPIGLSEPPPLQFSCTRGRQRLVFNS